MHRIIPLIFITAMLCVGGCATHQQAARNALPATTPYDTNVAARAVYLKFFREAHRAAAAGRTNITYAYQGVHVRAAIEGQWQGVDAGLRFVRERGLQQLRQGSQLPEATPYSRDPELRAAYLRSYRESYLRTLSGELRAICTTPGGVGEAYYLGVRDGQSKAEDDMLAVNQSWATQYLHLSDCMVRQQPQVRCGSSSNPMRGVASLFRAFLKLF